MKLKFKELDGFDIWFGYFMSFAMSLLIFWPMAVILAVETPLQGFLLGVAAMLLSLIVSVAIVFALLFLMVQLKSLLNRGE